MANDWKSLRRSFKKADAKNTGSVPLTDLKATLKAANVEMTEEEIYQIMSHFDTGLSGKIEYGRFLNEAFQLNSQNGMKKSILWALGSLLAALNIHCTLYVICANQFEWNYQFWPGF